MPDLLDLLVVDLLARIIGVVEKSTEVKCPLVYHHPDASPQYLIQAFLLCLFLYILPKLLRYPILENIPIFLGKHFQIRALRPSRSLIIERFIEGVNQGKIMVLLQLEKRIPEGVYLLTQ